MPKINVTPREHNMLLSIPFNTKGLLLNYSIKELKLAACVASKFKISFEMALDQIVTESKNHAI